MKKIDETKKDIDDTVAKSKIKGWIGKQLEKAVADLEAAPIDLTQIHKQGDPKATLKTLQSKVSALAGMKTELDECDQSSLKDVLAKVDTARNELSQAIQATHDQLEAVKYRLSKVKEVDRTKSLQDAHQRRKLIKAMKEAGWPDALAANVGHMVAKELVSTYPTTSDQALLDHSTVMFFEDSNALGKNLIESIDQFQAAASGTMDDKFKSITSYIEAADEREGGVVMVRNSANMPDTWQALGIEKPMYLDEVGASAWLCGSLPHTFRIGTHFPLPGVACIIRLAHVDSNPVTIISIPVADIVASGLTVLKDIRAWCSQKAGADIIKDKSVTITLTSLGQVIYVPYGFWPIVLARDGHDEPVPGVIWVQSIFSKKLLHGLDAKAWPAIAKANKEFLQDNSGVKVWGERMTTWDKLSAERAWNFLGGPAAEQQQNANNEQLQQAAKGSSG